MSLHTLTHSPRLHGALVLPGLLAVALVLSTMPAQAPTAGAPATPGEALGAEGLWAYETLAPGGGKPFMLDGYFAFRGGRFVQQSLNQGEPFDQQAAQAHAGTFTTSNGQIHLLTDVQLGVSPSKTPAVSSSPGREHHLTPRIDGDKLTLLFATGTVQTFHRVGPGRGEIIALDRGGLALVDGHFVLAADDGTRQVAGSGTFTRSGQTVTLKPERWFTAKDGGAKYSRGTDVQVAIGSGEIRIGTDAPWKIKK